MISHIMSQGRLEKMACGQTADSSETRTRMLGRNSAKNRRNTKSVKMEGGNEKEVKTRIVVREVEPCPAATLKRILPKSELPSAE
jgi:hypothetical protein